VLKEIRIRLLKMGGFETIDADSIVTHQGLFQWDGCIALVASVTRILQWLQPTVRLSTELETSMREAQPDQYPRVFVGSLRVLLGCVEELEDARFNGLAVPRIVEQGMEHERGRFDEKLADGSLTLERATLWMRSAVEAVELVDGGEAAYVRVHSAAMVSLVVESTVPITPPMCPETLLLDVDRLEQLRQEYRQAVAAMTLSVSATRFLTEMGNPMVDRPVILQIQAHLADSRPLDNLQGTIEDIRAMVLRSSLEDSALFVRAVFASLNGSLHALM
jgi:hypothetical protein